MAAAEVKTVTLFAALASVLGPLAAQYSLILAGAIIGAAIGTTYAPQMPKLWQSLLYFGKGLLAAVGCSLLFAIPATAAATFAAEKFGAVIDEANMLFAVSGLIGIFWRQALPMVPILGKRWADKQGGAE